MNIHDFIGEEFPEPIRSNNNIGDLRQLWHKAQKQRLKNQILRSTSGKIMPYNLLYYIPGLTTYCGLNGTTVMTGYMSGCYLFRFRYHGALYAAHVGTDHEWPERSQKAKEAWKAVAAKQSVSQIFGFDPLKDVSNTLLQKAMQVGHTPQIVGVWMANGSARIAVFANARNAGNRKILVGVETAHLRPWSSIQNDAKMQ